MVENQSGKVSAGQMLTVWALAFGCLIGSGCFRMRVTTLLPQADPIGSILGIALAGGIVLLVSYNYSTLAARFQKDSNSYQYIKHTMGMDHSFLAVWFLMLAYLSIVWSNALTLHQLFRFLFGDIYFAVWGSLLHCRL